MLTISDSMRSVTADTTRMTESHAPVPNILGPRDNFGRTRFVGSGSLGFGTGYHHTGGTGIVHENGSTNAGPHNSNLANKADPRVDSDMDGSRIIYTGGLSHNGHTSEIGGHTRANGPNTTTTTTTGTTTDTKPSMMEKIQRAI
jgi:hypothetical protein